MTMIPSRPVGRSRALSHPWRALAPALALAALAGVPRVAHGFCGFYVSGADTKLYNDATQVVLMREGTRTVLSMQNDYKGPAQDFAMVVPVPVVLQKENVKTLPHDVFGRVDTLASPRLVEYWEQDPCSSGGLNEIALAGSGTGQGFGSGMGRLGGSHSVTILAQFEVGEYEIVILSAKDSSGLDAWLRQNAYKIPSNAEPMLRPYVQAGAKFFVAKVNQAKVKFVDDPIHPGERRAELSPLRFHYDSDRFELPVRLGMLNSQGTQDLIVHVLAPNQRYAVANYPGVTIPTNLDVHEATRHSFGAFYASLFDRTLEKNPGAIVTEYVWPASSCDPCPGGQQGLSQSDLVTLGADVLPSTRMGPVGGSSPSLRQGATQVTGMLPPEVVQRIARQNFGRFRLCYENGLRKNPGLQGRVTVKFTIGEKGNVTSALDGGSDLPDKDVIQCVTRAFQNLSFPEPENGSVIVKYPIIFSPGGGSGQTGIASLASNFVLTRLHVRYGKDALGNDLVFSAAPAIVGGREERNAAGALETGAAPSSTSSFQARYAIRHAWTGSVACDKPRRGVWGGPWPGAGRSNETLSAPKLGLVARGSVPLGSYVPGGIALLGVAGGAPPPPAPPVSATPPLPSSSASAEDASPTLLAPPPAPPSRCGCTVVGARAETRAALGALMALGMMLSRRRRSNRT